MGNSLATAVRILSMDAVELANSGHPGAPMGMADIAVTLWQNHLKHNPRNPNWQNRDRFVLSNGHASMLLYSLLYLTGYDLSIEDIKNFRQLHSKTPGHPEFGLTPGVETTTGPLGQGIAQAVGLAIAETVLASQFNREKFKIVDHYTYVFLGDGCLMEGISHEACSLAGTLVLNKLIAFWDDNGISIDGEVHGWFNENVPQRFVAYGWNVIESVDGHDATAINNAINKAKKSDKPTLICCKTNIAQGSPNKQGSSKAHGSPLGPEEAALVREQLGWTHAPFEMPEQILQEFSAVKSGEKLEKKWQKLFAEYAELYPVLAKEFSRRVQQKLPSDFDQAIDAQLQKIQDKEEKIATRIASQHAIAFFGEIMPDIIGGSADLACSNMTMWEGSRVLSKSERDCNTIHFGVREFAMSAISNGIALHGGFVVFCATFLVFSDYARNAVRLAALSKLPTIFLYTHDSIGLGEDGPTHQPIEHLASLRLMPNIEVWRPCDSVETFVAWSEAILNKTNPTILALSRQSLQVHKRSLTQLQNIKRGGYILFEPNGKFDVIILATGSEVQLAMQAALKSELAVRVVSLPCVERFTKQDDVYRKDVLPPNTKRLVIEAGATNYWHQFISGNGDILGLDSYGGSGKGDKVFEHFGFTLENVLHRLDKLAKS